MGGLVVDWRTHEQVDITPANLLPACLLPSVCVCLYLSICLSAYVSAASAAADQKPVPPPSNASQELSVSSTVRACSE